MKKYLITLSLLVNFTHSYSQVGIGTNTPSTSSILEVSSSNKGVLFNKVSLQNITSPSPLANHQQGMWIYNIASAGTYPNNVVPGMYYNDGTKWILMTIGESSPQIGDIKPSVLTNDHEGWYKLDGRPINTITSSVASQNAILIGFTTSLPNSADRMLKGKSISENLAAIGGNNSINITQPNLPNYTIQGTTASDGAHNHSITTTGANLWHYVAGSSPTYRFLETETRTTSSSGNHSHTISVNIGGTNTPISNYPKNTTTQYYIFLGK
ncbi:hypothetical protein [Empedobacter brevis]|uniref:Phage tail collar domain-containing protein n=1 Tax=Empedobacter brevis NBRC 14943 = ATCC 43319 TaxID=1218108 RepID=A0A511NC97_9FLAO|nr:hypothetical protein [Empedobacter brevis]GEM50442.1 hypothetical protein EB1_02320 [Empedobacter brevis NBRC 14943 = ATCC 43319]